MPSLATISNGDSASTCRTKINAGITRLNNTAALTLDAGYSAPASAGAKATVIGNYSAVDFTTIDSGDFADFAPEAAAALSSLSTAVANQTLMLQAMLTSFIAFKVPCNTPPP